MREQFADSLIHFGYAANREQYASLLKQADVLPVTSHQDFFGISIVEAMYCGVCPVLPDRLTYPWLVYDSKSFLYQSFEDMVQMTLSRMESKHEYSGGYLKKRFDWNRIVGDYDDFFTNTLVSR